ncbi:hypothetical protein F4775DRAFT_537433 [Biscogniauxia sp. FL1348]|nr:hypothetical protein F4775DRAFT_537433 [Biscogniauxia sp. FL1348]
MADLTNTNQEVIAGPSHASPFQNQSESSPFTYTLVKQEVIRSFNPDGADLFVLVVAVEMEDKDAGSSFFAYRKKPTKTKDTKQDQTPILPSRGHQKMEKSTANNSFFRNSLSRSTSPDPERGESINRSPRISADARSTEKNGQLSLHRWPATPTTERGNNEYPCKEIQALECWLPDISPRNPAHIVRFSLDLSSGNFDFDAAAMHVLSYIAEYFGPTSFAHPSVVFLSHGYGSVLIRQILGYNKDSVPKTPNDWKTVQETLKLSTAAIITFASPLLSSITNIFIDWVAKRLELPKDSTPLFKMEFGKYRPFQKFATDRGIQLFDFWHRPLSTKHVHFERIEQEDGILTVANFSGKTDNEFKDLRRLIRRGVNSHRVLKAAASADYNTMDMINNHGISLKPVDHRGKTALHLAVSKRDIEMVKMLTNSKHFSYIVNKEDMEGDTALHHAIRLDSSSNQDDIVTIVEALLQHGARPDKKNRGGQTPLDIALNQPVRIAQLLETPQKVQGPQLKIMSKSKPPGYDGLQACKKTGIIITTFGTGEGENHTYSKSEKSVYELLYGRKPFNEIIRSLNHVNSTSPWKCRWFHIPMNNMAWVNDLFIEVNRERIWPWLSNFRDGRFPHSRCMPPQIGRLKSSRSSNKNSPKILALTMPYISYQGFGSQMRYNRALLDLSKRSQASILQTAHDEQKDFENESSSDESITSFAETSTSTAPRNHLDEVKDGSQGTLPEGIECSLRAYLNYQDKPVKLPLHPRRTLDQSYYYMLEDTSHRDETQVVSRWNHHNYNLPKIGREGGHGEAHNILMVDQLWLWIIPSGNNHDHSTVITCFPSREGVVRTYLDDLRSVVLSQSDREPLSNDKELVTRIIATCINVFGNNDVESLQFFKFFQSAIGHAEEEISRLFKDFRGYADRLYLLHEKHPEYQKRRSQYLKKLLDIRKESKVLEDVKDILDEIKMVQSVLKDQEEVIFKVNNFLKHEGLGLHNILKETVSKFKTMEDQARSVEVSLTQLFDLKQRQANLWEARSSREEVEETARQGNTLMVFTVVTIVFLPLSFMTSFFAISVTQFPHDQASGEVSWPLSYLFGLLFGISFAIVIPLLFVAFNIESLTGSWNVFRQVWLRHLMLDFLLLLKCLHGIRGIATWGNKWEQHTVRALIEHIMESKIGNDRVDRPNRIIEESWGVIPTKMPGTKLSDQDPSMAREEDRKYISTLLARGIPGDDDSSNGDADAEVKRSWAYKQLKKVLIRYYDEEVLEMGIESKFPAPKQKHNPRWT